MSRDEEFLVRGLVTVRVWLEEWPDPDRAHCDQCGTDRGAAIDGACPCGRKYEDMMRGQVFMEEI